ncbi:hypothetical protein IJH33_00280 [Candidatus Saccharibacteria bacterium]|nr:hypothetical protein [Candidatus Saccharibacteria bacterium]
MQPNQPNQPSAPGGATMPGMGPATNQAVPGGADPLVAGATASAGTPPMPPVTPSATPPVTSTAAPTAPLNAKSPVDSVSAPSDISSLIDEELAKPVATPAEVAPMSVEPKKKAKTNVWMIGMIVASVVALIGIVFGVMMMVQKNNSETSLNKQISTLKSQVTQLQNQIDEEPETVEVNPAGYVYIGEWGIKIATTARNYTFSNGVLNFLFDNGANVTITRILTSEIACDDTEGAECPQYNFEISDYSYLVAINGDVPADISSELVSSANYSLIYVAGENEVEG